MSDELADSFEPAEVLGRTSRFVGQRWDVVSDEVRLDHGEVVVRDYLVHPGAVGIIAIDDDDNVLLIRQYRHPVGYFLWEPPAGLMDAAGESALATAQRELYEEAGYQAADWHVLADWFNSPGGSSEGFRCFLARDVAEVEGGRPVRSAEETELPMRWVPLRSAVDLVLAGRIQNPTAVTGLLAAWAAHGRDWQDLRPGDATWPSRADLLAAERVWLP
jgi:8-oxo-dGTP pyrophosphatase MutT (NUDIX family)